MRPNLTTTPFWPLLCAGVLCANLVAARQFYAAPNGSKNNPGTIAAPWSLDTALRMPLNRLPAGDTLNLRGGVYKGVYFSSLQGTASKPIIVRNFPGERPILDAYTGIINNVTTLEADGDYTWYIGLEITNSSPSRISQAQNTSTVTDIQQAVGINVIGAGVKIINCDIHDLPGTGIGYWSTALDAEIYGCNIYNNGISAKDRGHGPNLYVQNNETLRPKALRNSFVFNSFSTGIQFYASANKLKGFIIDSNTVFNSGAPAWPSQQRRRNILAGGETNDRNDSTANAPRVDGLFINQSLFYRDTADGADSRSWPYADMRENAEFGYQEEGLSDKFLSVTNSHFYGDPLPMVIHKWDSGVFTGNFVYSYRSNTLGNRSVIEMANTSVPFKNWNNNTYHTNQAGFSLGFNGRSFDTWKNDYAIDNNSSFTNAHPQQNFVLVRRNKYTPQQFHVTVMNYLGQDSAYLQSEIQTYIGWRYEVYDVQLSVRNPISSGLYHGAPLGLNLRQTETADPMGLTPVKPKHTATLGTFVVVFVPQAVTVKGGDWQDPAIWSDGIVPQANADVLVRHPITIGGMAFCRSLNAGAPITVKAGTQLFVSGQRVAQP